MPQERSLRSDPMPQERSLRSDPMPQERSLRSGWGGPACAGTAYSRTAQAARPPASPVMRVFMSGTAPPSGRV